MQTCVHAWINFLYTKRVAKDSKCCRCVKVELFSVPVLGTRTLFSNLVLCARGHLLLQTCTQMCHSVYIHTCRPETIDISEEPHTHTHTFTHNIHTYMHTHNHTLTTYIHICIHTGHTHNIHTYIHAHRTSRGLRHPTHHPSRTSHSLQAPSNYSRAFQTIMARNLLCTSRRSQSLPPTVAVSSRLSTGVLLWHSSTKP